MLDYEIVATLGPSSEGEAIWDALRAAGATAFRLNTSHLDLPQMRRWVERWEHYHAGQMQPPLILDLQGSKWRLGDFPSATLQAGAEVTLIYAAASDQPAVLPVPHPDFFQAAPGSSGVIALNDARVRLAVEAATATQLRARVLQGGELSARKGITYTASEHRQEALSEKDRQIITETQTLPGVRYALSYVKDAVEMARYRNLIGPAAYLIAKLEREPAVSEAASLATYADELWLCRGDLGAEVGLRALAETVYRFSAQVSALPRPTLLAGQVLEHMTAHADPTRSELCYLYAALQQGYRGLVLSDETAVGHAPVAACRMAALFRDAVSKKDEGKGMRAGAETATLTNDR